MFCIKENDSLINKENISPNIQLLDEVTNTVIDFFDSKTNNSFKKIVSKFNIDIIVQKDNKNPLIRNVDFNKYVINLYYCAEITKEQMIFQLSHELTHLIFYGLYGNKYMHNNYEEESICVAMSLCVIKELTKFDYYEKTINTIENEKSYYKAGIDIAKKCNFEIDAIYKKIMEFDINEIVTINY